MTHRRHTPMAVHGDDATFWPRLRLQPSGCREWAGARNKQGYGTLQRRKVSSVPLLAHRYAWALLHGDPGTLDVLHTCDNPPCCEPSHLFLGTAADNHADCVAKGRDVPPPHPGRSHCKKGHALTPENRKPNGWTTAGNRAYTCWQCVRDRRRRAGHT